MTFSDSARRRLRRTLPGVLAAALLAGYPAAAPAQAPFSSTSAWNAPLADDAPLVADSEALVAELGRQVALPSGAWINTTSYSTPIYTVPADQPAVRVSLDVDYAPLRADFDRVPLPPGARVAAGSDKHLTVYQPSTDTLWEFWLMRRDTDGWHARWGGKLTGVSSSPGYLDSPLGATATSLPLLGGLMRIDELRTGHIDHALALAIPAAKANAVTWPAQRTDGKVTGAFAIAEGTRFRLDPRLDINALALPPVAAIMARAAQRYGIVVRDQAGAVTFYGEDPDQYGANPYTALYQGLQPSQLLARFPWARLQVVVPDRRAFAGPSHAPAPPIATPPPQPAPREPPGRPSPPSAPATPIPALAAALVPPSLAVPPVGGAPAGAIVRAGVVPARGSKREARAARKRCARKRTRAKRKRCAAAFHRRR